MFNIGICYVVSLFKEVVIDLEFIDLNHEIMYTYNRQHQLRWMWLWDLLFFFCGKGATLGVLLLEGQDDDLPLNPTYWSFHLKTKLFSFGKFTWKNSYIAIWLKRTLIPGRGVICMWWTIQGICVIYFMCVKTRIVVNIDMIMHYNF